MGLLPLDPSRVGQMCKVGCCLLIGSCWESRVFLVVCGIFPSTTRTRFSAWPPFAAAGHIPGCLLRKGGDVPGKAVSGANKRLTALPFGQAASAQPPVRVSCLARIGLLNAK
ncbi:hypothetical protein ACIFQM_03575 [Paenibacillus sp. NRS-1782]|uniref:hypothetical protein n=1 Tax=unclassified Paenibacillus TaxID=185978 RepID=UPI003D27745A